MRFTKIAFFIPVFLVVFAFGSVQSHANQYEFFTDRAAFLAEYPDLMIQNFAQSKVAPSSFENCASPANSNSNDDCFSPGDILSGLQFQSGPPGPFQLLLQGANGIGINNPDNSLVSADIDTAFDILFTQELYNIVALEIGCFGPALSTCEREVTVEVFGLGPVLIGSTTIDVTDTFQTFLGIAADEPIARVNLVVEDPQANIPGISEVRFGMTPRNVPTLSEWGLLATIAGLGVIGFIVIRSRKKAYN